MLNQKTWIRFLAESVAIVASILVAFGIDAWWDGRKDLAEEAELLHGLSEEFTENAKLLDKTLDLSLQGRADLQHFLSSSAEELASPDPPLTLHSAYEPFIRTWTASPAIGFLHATISSGKLALIRNAELRAALARFDGLQSDVSEVTWYTNELNLEAAKILGGMDEISRTIYRNTFLSAELLQSETLSGETLQRMRGNEELVRIGTAKLRYWDGYFYEVNALRANITEILALLEQERAQ